MADRVDLEDVVEGSGGTVDRAIRLLRTDVAKLFSLVEDLNGRLLRLEECTPTANLQRVDDSSVVDTGNGMSFVEASRNTVDSFAESAATERSRASGVGKTSSHREEVRIYADSDDELAEEISKKAKFAEARIYADSDDEMEAFYTFSTKNVTSGPGSSCADERVDAWKGVRDTTPFESRRDSSETGTTGRVRNSQSSSNGAADAIGGDSGDGCVESFRSPAGAVVRSEPGDGRTSSMLQSVRTEGPIDETCEVLKVALAEEIAVAQSSHSRILCLYGRLAETCGLAGVHSNAAVSCDPPI